VPSQTLTSFRTKKTTFRNNLTYKGRSRDKGLSVQPLPIDHAGFN